MKKRNVLFLLCAILLFSCLSPTASVFADEVSPPVEPPDDPEPFQEIAFITCNLDINSRGKTTDHALVYVWDETMTVNLYMDLQREVSTENWETVKSWSASGNSIVELLKEWYVLPGYTYRLLIGVTVYDTEGLLADATAVVSNYVDY